MHNRTFKMPNALIQNLDNFLPSTIGVAAVLYSHMSKHREFTGSLKTLALFTHRCKDTVSQALMQLEQAGYIKKTLRFSYSLALGKTVYAPTTYHILEAVQEDYTLIPYAWLLLDLTPCTVQTLFMCRMFMIKERERSYPSLRKIATLAGIAKATVCAAIKKLGELGILLIEHCKKENGAYSSNSYHIVKRIYNKAVELLGGKTQPTSKHPQIISSYVPAQLLFSLATS